MDQDDFENQQSQKVSGNGISQFELKALRQAC